MHRLSILLLAGSLSACADSAQESGKGAAPLERDPVIARALHDPLMSDPDLASRNEANAAIGFRDSSALPVLRATTEEAQAAREALRIELLASGPIPDLPPAQSDEAAPALGPMSSPRALLDAVGAPAACTTGLAENFALAASLPPAAAIPPLAMVVQAGGSDRAGCRLRIVRYLTAAPRQDVLQYHNARAARAGLRGERRGDSIAASGRGAERLAVVLREAPNGLTGVTLVYRAN